MNITALSTRLVSIIVLMSCLQIIPLFGQQENAYEKWVGVHNVYYQNKKILTVDTAITNDNRELVSSIKDYDKTIALGLFYRIINEHKTYHQIDILSLELTKREDLRLIEIIGTDERSFFGINLRTIDIQLGYRLGKMLSFQKRLTADASVGAYPTYIQQQIEPFSSASFPQRDTRIGFSLDARLGLNYQIHRRINIGYSLVPFVGKWFWHQVWIDNPILTEHQKRTETFNMDIHSFDNIIDTRNFSICYTFSSQM